MFWRRRKKSVTPRNATLGMEKLEDRTLLTAIPIVSGHATTFFDDDGTRVTVKLRGPGQGTLELANGEMTGAAIDSLMLSGTTGESKLDIATRGGAVKGTTINHLVIEKALNQLGALGQLRAKGLDLSDGGELRSDGFIGNLVVRSVGAGASIDVMGDIGRLKTWGLGTNATVDVSGTLYKFLSKVLDTGSQISAHQLDLLKVASYAQNATIDVGAGGVQSATINQIYNSVISSDGNVGRVVVRGNMMGTSVASNIDAGSDGVLGTIDDFVIDSAAAGSIGLVKVGGAMGMTGDQEVRLVASGTIGGVRVGGRDVRSSSVGPMIWQQAASQFIPLSISQAALDATGFADDKIWIAVFGEEIPTPASGQAPPPAQAYYLDASNLNGTNPKLTTTQALVPTASTPNLPIVPSSTIAQWKNASKAWGSNLAFPVPISGDQWTGRIVISAGAPVQAQVNQDTYHTVSAPSATNPIDPSTGTFYDFLEFTVTNTSGTPSLDVDTSQVDSFGMPTGLQFFQDSAGTQPFNFTFTGNTSNTSASITNVTNLNQLVLGGLGTGQPITGAGIPLGTTIQAYDIDALTITMTKPATATSTAVSLTVDAAGPVGVVADRDAILSGATSDALFQFIQDQLTNGNAQAQPFLQSAAPFAVSGPTPIDGIQINAATIGVNSIGNLAADDVIAISGVQGTTTLNGNFVVDVVTPTLLTLGGPTGSGAYTSGGQWNVPGGSQLAITGASNNNLAIVITTSSTTGLVANDVVTISGVQGNTAANGTFLVAGVTGTTITLGSPVGTQTYTSGGVWSPTPAIAITGASNQGPIVITTGSTAGLLNNDTVSITGVTGNTAANSSFTVSNVTATTFELDGSMGNGAYTGGGTWTEVYSITGATDGGEMLVTTDSTTGLSNGDAVSITGVTGNTAANGEFTVSNVTPTSFTLDGATGNAAYASHGSWAFAITGATTSQAVITTSSTTWLANDDTVTISGVQGNTAVNGQFLASNVTSTSITLGGPIGNAAYTGGGSWSLPNAGTTPITGASNNTPIVVTTSNTAGLLDGDSVLVSGVAGNTAANGLFTVSGSTATTFTLANSTGNGAYTEGGAWQIVQPITGATNGSGPIVITADSTAGLEDGTVVEIEGVQGNTAANGQFVVTNVTSTTFTLGSPAGTSAYTSGGTWSGSNGGSGSVTGATNGGLILISADTTLGLENGDLVEVTGVLGNTAANGFYFVSNVASNSFTLEGSAGSGTYTSGGTWSVNAPGNRLVSPKDIVEGLSSPQDPNGLNNYYNEMIDDFFLQYLPATEMVSGQYGGDQTFSLVSTASESSQTYSGTVTNDTTTGGYVLRLNSSDATDTTNYDIYYPWFATTATTQSNAPASDIYTPLFPLAAPPSWITTAVQQNESASQMIFACDAVFADNVSRGFMGTPSTIMGDLENSISAAFNRGIALNATTSWGDSATWFPATGTYNYWVEYWHQQGLTYGDLAYAFPYDDKFGASTNLDLVGVGLAQVTLGSWSASASASTTAFQSPPSSAAFGAQVMLSALVTGSTPTGTVTFFINGVPINSNNHGSGPPLEPIAVDGSGLAAITANLPSMPDAGTTHTYTMTAVYSGDSNNLPSIAYSLLQLS